jgi:ferrochelatase
LSRFSTDSNHPHSRPGKIGVLITNLGTPDAPTARALRRYLHEFLSDRRVVEIPRLLWWLILNGIILNVRPRRSAKIYAGIWQAQGSPLMIHTQQQHAILQQRLTQNFPHVVIEFAMRYGSPSIDQQLHRLRAQGAEYLLILPLYPQYSGSTTGSTFDALSKTLHGWRWVPELRFINHYHDHPAYIHACVQQIRAHWQTHGEPDQLILSYHGLPKRYLLQGDPYYCHCQKTSRLISQQLNWHPSRIQTCFQSRFGKAEWLQPYLDKTLMQLGTERKIKHVQVFCPGFAADCLETLEEINIENRHYFLDAGGEKFSYIPALNNTDAHIDCLLQIIEQNLKGWVDDNSWQRNFAPVIEAMPLLD